MKDLVPVVGVSTAALYTRLEGKTGWRREELKAVAAALGADVSEITGETGDA